MLSEISQSPINQNNHRAHYEPRHPHQFTLIASAFLGVLFWMHQRDWSFTKRVFSQLSVSALFLGAAFQAWYGLGSEVIKETNIWLDVVGAGYVKLLQMVVAAFDHGLDHRHDSKNQWR